MELQTNERTDEWKDENYIPLGINAGGIMNDLTDWRNVDWHNVMMTAV